MIAALLNVEVGEELEELFDPPQPAKTMGSNITALTATRRSETGSLKIAIINVFLYTNTRSRKWFFCCIKFNMLLWFLQAYSKINHLRSSSSRLTKNLSDGYTREIFI